MNSKFDGWPPKTIGHLFYTALSFLRHFKAVGEFKLELQSGNAQLGSKSAFFFSRDLEIWRMTFTNKREPPLYWVKLCALFQSHGLIKTGVTVRKCSIRVKVGDFFVPCDLEIWQMTLKNNRAPLLNYVKFCASFQSHRWIQTWVIARKFSIRVKICDLLSRVNLKYDGRPWKTIFFFNLCASFHSHQWIPTGVTVRKRQVWVKINDFLSRATLKFDRWPWKIIGHLFCATSSFMHRFNAMVNSNWNYSPETPSLG